MTQPTDLSATSAAKSWQYFAVLITVAAFLLLSKLAWWQWQRAEEKTRQLQQIASWQQQDGVPVTQLKELSLPALDGAPLRGQVRWLSPYIWLLDNQIVNGRVGYDVVVPVQAQDNKFLLNLGWIEGRSDRADLPQVAIPEVIELQGVLRTEPRPFLLGQNIESASGYPQRIQAVLPLQLAEASGLQLADAVFYQQQSSFIPHYQPVILPPEKHRAYALQWALLAVAVVFVALAVRYQRGQHE